MDPITRDSGKAMTIHGVPGRLMRRTVKPGERAGCWTHQGWRSEGRPINGYGKDAKIYAELRFDDECSNGHNTFAITGEVKRPRARDIEAGGCIHDEIAKHFPELAHLIPWHLCSTDGPMHYLANTIYDASDRDHNGKRAGEPCRFKHAVLFDDVPVAHILRADFLEWLQERDNSIEPFKVVAVAHGRDPGTFGPKYTFVGFSGGKWHTCPFDSEAEAEGFAQALNQCRVEFVKIPTAYSEGKDRDLDAARRCAIWPEATDEQLSAEPDVLRAALTERLPGLIERFRHDMEACGFIWAPEDQAE